MPIVRKNNFKGISIFRNFREDAKSYNKKMWKHLFS